MLAYTKVSQKVLSQYITVYQSIQEFELDKFWLEIIIKHNKSDDDNLLDDVNAKLIEVCGEYLEWKQLWMDKFWLSTLVMQLYTTAISQCEAPFKVVAKEHKQVVKEYLEKNKAKLNTLERIKQENEWLDNEIAELEKESQNKKKKIKSNGYFALKKQFLLY